MAGSVNNKTILLCGIVVSKIIFAQKLHRKYVINVGYIIPSFNELFYADFVSRRAGRRKRGNQIERYGGLL